MSMTRPVTAVTAVFALLVLAGCTQSSYPQSHFNSSQETLKSATHWQVLAKDTAAQIVSFLHGYTYASGEPRKGPEPAPVFNKPLYVEPFGMGMSFGEAFHEDLVTALIDQGWTVSMTPDDAIVVHTRVQLILREGNVPLNSFPGKWSILGGAVYALENGFRIGSALGTAAAADIYDAAQSEGGAQVNITTSLIEGDIFLLRRTGAYFIADVDMAQYASHLSSSSYAPRVQVDPTPPPVRTFNVVDE